MAALTPGEQTTSYPAIDRFRRVAAGMVVAIHTAPLASLQADADFLLCHVLCRLAVPFFMMASGFFLARQSGRPLREKLAAFTLRLGGMYLLAMLLYLPVNLYMGYFGQEKLFIHLLRDLFWNGTFYHLWYFPAMMLGCWLAAGLWRLMGRGGALAVAALLYLAGLLGDSYYGLAAAAAPLKNLLDGLFLVFDYTRNGLFFAPLFILLGFAAAGQPPPQGRAAGRWGAFALALLLMAGEALLLRHLGWPRHNSMLVMLPAASWLLFRALDAPRQGKDAIGALLRRLSMLIYLLHPLVIVALRFVAGLLGLRWLFVDISPVFFLSVFAGSVLLALAVVLVGRLLPPGRRRPARVEAEIDRSALADNLDVITAALPAGCRVMAVVKADAYGHGLLPVARLLRRRGVDGFAVATLGEAVRLRLGGIGGRVLILGHTPPEAAIWLWLFRLSQTVVDAAHGRALAAAGWPLRVQIKVDTGMHRLGVDWRRTDEAAALYRLAPLRVEGLFTHFARADGTSSEDVSFTKMQAERFYSLCEALRLRGISPGERHLQASGGLVNHPGLPCEWVRVGLALYGAQAPGLPALRPVLSLRARVASLRCVAAGEQVGYGGAWRCKRDSVIATLAAGYADGVPRAFAGSVLVGGGQVPVAGRVSMDQMAVDVTGIANVCPGDMATLIGDDGAGRMTAGEVAAASDTIPNELLCRLGARVKRRYTGLRPKRQRVGRPLRQPCPAEGGLAAAVPAHSGRSCGQM